jgi:diguanylate cyclase (GGDEF)-like protein/PAS domain S-box-containing protein
MPEFAPEQEREQVQGLVAGVREYAIFRLDVRGHVTSWNVGAQQIKGYAAEEVLGRHFSLFYPPELVADGLPDRALAEAAANGSHITEGWRLRKDGSRFWAHAVITPLLSPDDELQGFTKITRDDTASRARLDRSSRRFSGLLALAPVGIALADGQHRLIEVNPALSELLQYSPTCLRGRPIDELLSPQDQHQPLLPGGSGNPRQLVRASGQLIQCEISSAPSTQDDGSRLWLVTFQDVTERVRHTEELRREANHDPLTGLLNRRGINERIAELRGRTAAVLCADLTNFTRVKDVAGHDAGDELLVALGRRLRAQLEPDCAVGRISGDEFVVVCPDVEALGGVEKLASEVQRQLRDPALVRGQVVRFSAAIGAATAEDTPPGDQDLLRYADAAMAQAKRRGPGSLSRTGRDLLATLSRQFTLEEQLRSALENDELVLHHQPIIRVDGSVAGSEALVRWQHPQLGLLGPGEFLPVAEQANMMRELDRWVLRTALREAATWSPGAGAGPLRVGVNLAGLLPDDPLFTDEITEALTTAGVAPERLLLEFVETTLVNLPEHARTALGALSERGVRFAIDDFGTGYSSLARLKDLPADVLKADRDFIAHIASDPGDFAVVRAVVDMARALGKQCVAEGVETAEQREALHELAVDAYQGWLFSPPLPARDFRRFLQDGSSERR